MTRRQIATALAAALAIPGILAGCSSAPSDSALSRTLETAVMSEVPHAVGAVITLSYDGSPTRRIAKLKVYLDSVAPADVSAAVDSALRIGWTNFPVRPIDIAVAIVDGPKLAGVRGVTRDGIDLEDAAARLGIDPEFIGNRMVTLPARTLAERYGKWKKTS